MPKTDLWCSQPELASFTAPVRAWFEEQFGRPTPPQAQGWPAIQRGDHTLILAPTGSGKTLAAFLLGLDRLFRELAGWQDGATAGQEAVEDQRRMGRQQETVAGVRLLYISPLKALNNDIQRNLRVPLAGIRVKADRMGIDFPEIRVAVRSGDTPPRERQAMLRQPPHILITTPESFYLMLTSPVAREMFRSVRTLIVDEIHTLAGNKRGAHLSVSLERLQHLAEQPVQRIGLSATIRPLEEVARFLGGNVWQGEGEERSLQPRPVTVIDAAYRKALDLKVVTVVDDFRHLPGDSIWPSIIPRVLALIREHQTTLIFANNRRQAERTADRLNEQIAAEAEGRESGIIAGGVVKGIGILAAGDGTHSGPIRVHHGSVSREVRQELERQLKAGELPALVGTSSLELGIDIGAVDLIVQLQSPKSVAQGLQRIGRSGHLVGQTSKGRIFPTHCEDVIEAAAIAGGMLRGEVELTLTPRCPLDVLAQQIVAMVSAETWDVDAAFDLVRGAYAYGELTRRVFLVTLEMLAGRYPSQAYRELRARVSWDRVNNKLAALPGSRMLAVTNGGTIPNTGSFGAYLGNGTTKLGELDEEFVFETHIGDTFMLGSQVWRVVDLNDDRVVVAEAPGAVPRMPFWRGEYPWRPYELGRRVGAFRRTIAERLEQVRCQLELDGFWEIREKRDTPPVRVMLDWLGQEYALDALSAWHAVDYLIGQLDHAGAVSSERTILVEVFEDALGDPRLVVHSPFGGRVNGPWGLALVDALRERMGIEIELQTNDDGILFRLLDSDAEFPLDVVTGMGPAEARERILRELPNSAVFGARFRQNAARALLLPAGRAGKRTPFWLQRLRARDLLQVVRQFDDFPILAETVRDCLQDVMDLPHLEEVLEGIQQGEIQVIVLESVTPSPVAQSLLYDFINIHMYEWDTPKAEKQLQALALSRELLQDLLKDVALDKLLRPEAIEAVCGQLQHTIPDAWVRTVEELAILLQQFGDLASSEIAQRATVDPANWVARLSGEGRIVGLSIPTAHGPEYRWVATEYQAEYEAAFEMGGDARERVDIAVDPVEARRTILGRFLGYAGPVTLQGIRARYAFDPVWLEAELERLIEARQLVHGQFTPRLEGARPEDAEAEFVDRQTLERIHRRTLHILRHEVKPVPFTVYADFLARWQHIHPQTRLGGEGALAQVLQQLRAFPVVGRIWEQDVLPLRLKDYQPAELETLCQNGELVWIGSGGADPRRGRVRFLFRGEGSVYLEAAPDDEMLVPLSDEARGAYAVLKSEGALFFADLCAALGLEREKVERTLAELFMAGLVTNDSLTTMRKLVEQASPRAAERKPLSSLEEDLAQRRRQLGPETWERPSRPSPAQYRHAKRRVRDRFGMRGLRGVGAESRAESLPDSRWVGRWTAVHRFGVLGKAVPVEERAARQTRQLLARYGVVTYACLADETGSWEWPLISRELQRLEMRGEVRRGYFVQGLSGLQFALPDVVEQLRELRDSRTGEPAGEEADLVVMNACDPANLYGPARDQAGVEDLQEDVSEGAETPAEAVDQMAAAAPFDGGLLNFARLPSTWLVQHRGLPILIAGNRGTHLTVGQGIDSSLVQQALRALLAHLGRFESRVVVETWNGEPILETAGRALLEPIGFYRLYPGMVWERRP